MNIRKGFHFLYLISLFICIVCDTSFIEDDESGEFDSAESKTVLTNNSEYFLRFTKQPANVTIISVKNVLKLKCEVALSRYLNETINSSLKYEDIQNTTDILLRKIKIRWLKNEAPITADKTRISIKKSDGPDGTVFSSLRIRNVEIHDKSSYACVASIGKNSIKSTTALVDVQDNEEVKEIPPFKPFYTKISNDLSTVFPSHSTKVFTDYGYGFTNQDIIPSMKTKGIDEEDEAVVKISNSNSLLKSSPFPGLEAPQEICQLYRGAVCAEFLRNQYVFIPYPTTQMSLEEKLVAAFKVVNYSTEISSNCVGYAIPSLCFSTFPVCLTPNETNILFFQHINDLNESKNKMEKSSGSNMWEDQDDGVLKVQFENLPPGGLPAQLSPTTRLATSMQTHAMDKFSSDSYNNKYSSPGIELHINSKTKKVVSQIIFSKPEPQHKFVLSRSTIPLRRVCKEDCEILEHELCQTEYAIARRHPEIGQKLTLENCQDLPSDPSNCLEIGIEKHLGTDTCYWETGIYYRGNVNTSISGLPCLKWSLQFKYKMAYHPELTGKHNFCRNPGGKEETQPWCFVGTENNVPIKEICDIPKCSQKIWIYIICSMLGIIMLFTLCAVLICCRQRSSKNNNAAIRNINLPNADKNIYGNSRLNSPIELTDLLTQNTSGRTNGISRVPQFSLTQIKFVEELGEGAFGKVYKGELTRENDKIFVAVKALKENASQKTQQDFKREIELISELRHENIVCILGVVLREEPLCMLFEFMAKGDLHEFLMEKAPPEGSGLSPTQFLMIAQHIASGMEYLAAHHYVHRDLAARNCLVAENLIVKISDFGLSRDIYSSDYYRVQSKSLLPVRWMPPESILYGKFTTESDVWSYGVVLWEIYSYGLQPYYGYSNQEVISMVRGRQLLQCPTDCPRTVYALMRECWHQTSSKRPNFTFITQRLSAWLRPNSNLHCDTTSDSSGANISQRAPISVGDPRERIPLIGNHSSSNGSLAGSMPRKLSAAGSVRSHASGRLMMSSSDVTSSSDNCESNVRLKKSSCGSLLESGERHTQKETVVKIPTMSQPFDI